MRTSAPTEKAAALQTFRSAKLPLSYCLSSQREQIRSRDEVGEGVEHHHRVDVVLFHIGLDAGQVIAQVEQVNFGKALREEGGQAVGLGVPDQEHLGGVLLLGLDDAQGLVAAQEEGVFVLLLQVGRDVQ